MVSKLLSASVRSAIERNPQGFATYLRDAIPEQVAPFGLERISKDLKSLSKPDFASIVNGLPKISLHVLLVYLQYSVWEMEAKKKTKQWEDDKRSQAIGDNPNLLEVLKYDIEQQKTITKKGSRITGTQWLDTRSTIADATSRSNQLGTVPIRVQTKGKTVINEVLKEKPVAKTKGKVKSNFEMLGTIFVNGLALEMMIGSDTSELSTVIGGVLLTNNVAGYWIGSTINDIYMQTIGGIANLPDALKDKFDKSVQDTKDKIDEQIKETKEAVSDSVNKAVEEVTGWIPDIDIPFIGEDVEP